MKRNTIILLVILVLIIIFILYKNNNENMVQQKSKNGNKMYDSDISLFKTSYNDSLNKKDKIVLDSLGKMNVPYDKYWGGVTARYIKFFNNKFYPKIPKDLIKSYAILKMCAANVNYRHKFIGKYQENMIRLVCNEILSDKLNDNFPLTVWQTGSGTTTNMNVNEVISNRANEITLKQNNLTDETFVHQNDHVNKSQSSNDSFTSNLHIYFVIKIITELQPVLQKIIYTLHKKENEFKNVLKLGRTHLQDAVPLTFGQEFSGYRALIETNFKSILDSLNYLYQIPLGGTAVGTGTNSFPEFGEEFCNELNNYLNKNINSQYENFVKNNLLNTDIKQNIFSNQISSVKFISSPNKFADISANNSLMILSSAIKELGINLYKIANDIRLMASGPRTGLNEIKIPQNEPGSSIMPGKVNPTQAEVIVMIGLNIIANDLAISMAGSQGQFEMIVCRPLIFYKLNESIETLVYFLDDFNDYLLDGIKINDKKVKYYLKNSLEIATLLNNEIGYEEVSKMVHYANDNDLTLEDACRHFGHMKLYDKIIRPLVE